MTADQLPQFALLTTSLVTSLGMAVLTIIMWCRHNGPAWNLLRWKISFATLRVVFANLMLVELPPERWSVATVVMLIAMIGQATFSWLLALYMVTHSVQCE